ncbi:MAG: DUF4249 domain-containing protein [Saprospiraceae bacterium]|nr:DUF4249 domain-containing protein [Saprospiraceae bacterium]
MRLLLLLIMSAALFWYACVDEIQLAPPDLPDSGMLVQGKMLYGYPAQITAEVFELYTLSSNLPRPIGGAKVTLEDNQNRSIPLLSSATGFYFLTLNPDHPDFPLLEGNSYRLKVELPNGRAYQSAWETLLPAIRPDSLSVQFALQEYTDGRGELRTDTFARFGIHTPLQATGQAPFFRWELEQGYKLTDDEGKTCYVVRDFLSDNVFALNSATVGVGRLDNYFLTDTRVDYRFAEGFYMIAYQQRISGDAFGYFEELKQLLSKKGTLFDPPVGAIRSNITGLNEPEELTYGFFYVARQDTLRLYVSPEAVNYPKPYCPLPPINGSAPNPNACDDCLLELGAVTFKPDWWEF